MYRNVCFAFLAIICLLCFASDYGVDAQLNFSTGWGKRSQRVGIADWTSRIDCATHPGPSLEQLLTVYNLIQAEARRTLDCRKLSE